MSQRQHFHDDPENHIRKDVRKTFTLIRILENELDIANLVNEFALILKLAFCLRQRFQIHAKNNFHSVRKNVQIMENTSWQNFIVINDNRC